ncbi:hypothetical protein BDQ12DRAFT_473844 [Crucibulum laeve]|uniref:Uncharacterized protein n=1 Tax=Crucibulum laeve TaxID=68775 RepID=A0A5C3LJ38_9AGAR|nr:hypothetical protein BDQ12DRAFT_473844 [Crucibulum laeve]
MQSISRGSQLCLCFAIWAIYSPQLFSFMLSHQYLGILVSGFHMVFIGFRVSRNHGTWKLGNYY